MNHFLVRVSIPLMFVCGIATPICFIWSLLTGNGVLALVGLGMLVGITVFKNLCIHAVSQLMMERDV